MKDREQVEEVWNKKKNEQKNAWGFTRAKKKQWQVVRRGSKKKNKEKTLKAKNEHNTHWAHGCWNEGAQGTTTL